MKKILVPIDFSQASKHAAEFSVELAERSAAEVLLLHSVHFEFVDEFPHTRGLDLQELTSQVKKSASENMEELVSQLSTNVKIRTRISNLHFQEIIKDIVKEENIGLVVQGTKENSEWSELLVGANMERIVRWTGCPVIPVPHWWARGITEDTISYTTVPVWGFHLDEKNETIKVSSFQPSLNQQKERETLMV